MAVENAEKQCQQADRAEGAFAKNYTTGHAENASRNAGAERALLRGFAVGPGREFLEFPDFFQRLTFTDESGFVAVDQHFSRSAAAVVVRSHCEPVSARAEQSNVVARSEERRVGKECRSRWS